MSDSRNRPTIDELEAILGDPNAPAVEITTAGEVVMKGLRHEIEQAVNRVSAENGSNTPDFILAEYLVSSLAAFDRAVQSRERWYGRPPGLSGLSTQQKNQQANLSNPA